MSQGVKSGVANPCSPLSMKSPALDICGEDSAVNEVNIMTWSCLTPRIAAAVMGAMLGFNAYVQVSRGPVCRGGKLASYCNLCFVHYPPILALNAPYAQTRSMFEYLCFY